MRPADIKRLEKVRDLYGKITKLLSMTEKHIDENDNSMFAHILMRMRLYASGEQAYLRGKINELKEEQQ